MGDELTRKIRRQHPTPYERAIRLATDRQYMIDALVPMLGPKAREVWQQWQAQGLQRVHFDWQDDIMALSGEEVAERHLQINEACKTAEPVDMAELDAHLPPQRKVSDIIADITRATRDSVNVAISRSVDDALSPPSTKE